MQRIKVVSIGGGTGQASLLRGLKQFDLDLTAIVTVLDSGRSTGVIRKKFNIAAPGDIRNCIIALSESEEEFNKIFQHRFKKHFEGMNVGNLVFAALTEMKGSFEGAIEEFSKLFNLKGNVYPSTLKNTHICAELVNGKKVCSEHEVRNSKTPQVKKVWLKDKKTKGYEKALRAIKKADYIIIGPGGLYTSIIVNFLVEDIRKAVVNSKAKKIFVPNLATQPGVSENTSILHQINEINKYLTKGKKKAFEYLVVNNKKPPENLLKKYAKDKSYYIDPIEKDLTLLKKKGFHILKKNLINRKISSEWKKSLYIRHEPIRLAEAIMEIITPEKPLKGVILAAGSGSRMKPFSLSTSKVMLNFLGKPLLAHHVDELTKNGISDIIFICNKYNIEEIKIYFKKYYKTHTFNYVIQEKQLGPAHALLSAQQFLRHSYFLLKYGDSIAEEDQIKGILKVFKDSKEKKGVVTLRDVDNPSEYGIARFQNGRLVEIVEKPKKNFPSKLANVGLAILDANSYFKSIHKQGHSKILPPPQYLLMEKHSLNYWISRSRRVDVGRAHNILSANQLLIDKFGGRNESQHVAKSAKISKKAYVNIDAVIEPHAVIGDYSSVEGFVGKNTKILNSVIMKNTKIGENCKIENSVIGKNNFLSDKFITKVGEAKVYIKDKYILPGMKVGVFTGDNVIIKKNIKSEPGKMVFPNKIISDNIHQDKLIRTLVFDADNTLYDTKAIAGKADMAAMNFFARKTNKKALSLYKNYLSIVKTVMHEKNPKKRTRKYSYNLLLKKINTKNCVVLVNKGYQLFLNTTGNLIKIMPDFNKIKPHLKKYALVVCTEDRKDLFQIKFKKLNLEDFFDLIITSNDVGEMKPSKKYYDLLFKKIDQVPNECLFIGDNYEKDLSIPQKMGATTVLFSKNNNTKADFKIKNYSEFATLLKEI